MSVQLMPHQIEGGKFLASQPDALLHWDMRTGKTYAGVYACDVARNLDEKDGLVQNPILVLCPAVARRNWAREFEKAQCYPRRIIVIEKGTTPVDDADVIVCSYDLASRPEVFRRLNAFGFGVLILDELQYCKNPQARRTQAVFGHRGNYTSGGLVAKADQIWALSGTPAPNHIGELFPWVKETHPHLLTRGRSYTSFLTEYCKIEETPFGIKVVGNKTDEVKRLWSAMSPRVMRVREEDVRGDLPAMRYAEVEVDGNNRAAIRHMEKQYADQIKELVDGLEGRAPLPADHLTTMRRVTEAAKVSDAVSILTDELRDHAVDKVVVFANFIDNITALVEGLEDFNPVAVHGSVSPGKRQAAIDQFRDGDACRVFVGQMIAAGTAIDLSANGKCRDVVCVSLDYVPGNNAQAMKRIVGPNQTGATMARVLKLAGSVDEQIQAALMRKTRMLAEAFGEQEHPTNG